MSDWMFFSPTEVRIVELLVEGKALSRDEIARKLDESVDGRIRGILATLVARRVLANGPEGYYLHAPDEKRALIRNWLARLEESVSGKVTTKASDETTVGGDGNAGVMQE